MIFKLIGITCVLTACGGFGFWMAYRYLHEEKLLRELVAALDHMDCELQCRLTPLPKLCYQVSKVCSGEIARIFQQLAVQMENQVSPDVKCCMSVVLGKFEGLPKTVITVFEQLGTTLGKFDLQGQLKGINSARTLCNKCLEALNVNREARIRGYQTLGLCAGAAIIILFI